MLAAEIQHLLGFGQAADERARERASAHEEGECPDGNGLLGGTDEHEVAVPLEKVQVGVDVVRRGDGVEDEVEGARLRGHLGLVGGHDDLVSAEPLPVSDLALGGREEDNVGAEGFGKLHGHVTQAAEPDDADFLPGTDLPASKGGIGRDSCAQEGRRRRQVEIGGHAQHKILRDNDALGVAAEGRRAQVLLNAPVGPAQHAAVAELLEARPATRAGAARIDEAADPDGVADLELGDAAADRAHRPHDLVAGNGRVLGEMPLIAREMKV